MFNLQRQSSRKIVSGCKFVKRCRELSARGEYSRCLATCNTQLNQQYIEVKRNVENAEKGCVSRISEGLSHHYHQGAPLLDMTVGQLLTSGAERWPNRECIVSAHQGVRLTFSELVRRADRLAAGLISLGLKRGDRVGLWGPNDIEWFVAFMAITRAGFIMVGINPAYQQTEIDYCLQKINASAVIAPTNFRTQNFAKMLLKAKESCPSLQHIILYSGTAETGTRSISDVEALPNNAQVQAIAAMQTDISPLDGCNIQFTSGTTGNPKATLLSHKSFVNNSRQTAARAGLMDGDHKICMNVPMFHAFGMVMGQFSGLHSGATIVLEAQAFDPKASINTIIKEKCTVCYGTPTMWVNLLDARSRCQAHVDTLQFGVTGGSPVSPHLIRRIRNELSFDRMQNIYGMTETTAVTFQSLPGESHELTDHTVGHLQDNVEVKVVDADGATLPIETPGELWVRGYCTMIKYWDDEENTKKTLTEDGWLKTGDQFVLRPDGYGQVVGRLKDMIIRGGENIFPREIEHFLETHPRVLEAYVFGVHDDVYGEELCACVRLSEGEKLETKDIHQFSKGKIAHFKIPRYVAFMESFARTMSGKIQKFKMRQELERSGMVPSKPQN